MSAADTDVVVVDLAEPDEPTDERVREDAAERSQRPRNAIATATRDVAAGGYGSSSGRLREGDPAEVGQIVALATRHAGVLADARCGIDPDAERGPAYGSLNPGLVTCRGSLRWYRYYIATLDELADKIAPSWRVDPRNYASIPQWVSLAFGPVCPHGDDHAPPAWQFEHWYRGPLRDMSWPTLTGRWPFELPARVD